MINPELERFMSKRAKSDAIELPGSHAIFLSHPKEVAALIEKAAKAAAIASRDGISNAPAEIVRSPLRTLFSRDYRSILLINLLLTIGGGSVAWNATRAETSPAVIGRSWTKRCSPWTTRV